MNPPPYSYRFNLIIRIKESCTWITNLVSCYMSNCPWIISSFSVRTHCVRTVLGKESLCYNKFSSWIMNPASALFPSLWIPALLWKWAWEGYVSRALQLRLFFERNQFDIRIFLPMGLVLSFRRWVVPGDRRLLVLDILVCLHALRFWRRFM